MSQPALNNDELDLSEYSIQALETIQIHIQEFVNSSAHEFFQLACRSQFRSLTQMALTARLSGVESLFTRESLLGEALNSDKFKDVFPQLLEDISNEITNRTKPKA